MQAGNLERSGAKKNEFGFYYNKNMIIIKRSKTEYKNARDRPRPYNLSSLSKITRYVKHTEFDPNNLNTHFITCHFIYHLL